MNFKIRDVASKNFEQVSAILSATFLTNAESKLVEILCTKGKAVISLVAAGESDEVLGHILFSPVSTTPLSGAKGIGSELIREGLRPCKELANDYDIVLGNPRCYQRFGFTKGSNFGLQNEYGGDDQVRLSALRNVARCAA